MLLVYPPAVVVLPESQENDYNVNSEQFQCRSKGKASLHNVPGPGTGVVVALITNLLLALLSIALFLIVSSSAAELAGAANIKPSPAHRCKCAPATVQI